MGDWTGLNVPSLGGVSQCGDKKSKIPIRDCPHDCFRCGFTFGGIGNMVIRGLDRMGNVMARFDAAFQKGGASAVGFSNRFSPHGLKLIR